MAGRADSANAAIAEASGNRPRSGAVSYSAAEDDKSATPAHEHRARRRAVGMEWREPSSLTVREDEIGPWGPRMGRSLSGRRLLGQAPERGATVDLASRAEDPQRSPVRRSSALTVPHHRATT